MVSQDGAHSQSDEAMCPLGVEAWHTVPKTVGLRAWEVILKKKRKSDDYSSADSYFNCPECAANAVMDFGVNQTQINLLNNTTPRKLTQQGKNKTGPPGCALCIRLRAHGIFQFCNIPVCFHFDSCCLPFIAYFNNTKKKNPIAYCSLLFLDLEDSPLVLFQNTSLTRTGMTPCVIFQCCSPSSLPNLARTTNGTLTP